MLKLSHRALVLRGAEEANISMLSHRDSDLLDGLGRVVGDMDVDIEWLSVVVQLFVQGSL